MWEVQETSSRVLSDKRSQRTSRENVTLIGFPVQRGCVQVGFKPDVLIRLPTSAVCSFNPRCHQYRLR
jgi:hypothetical protein